MGLKINTRDTISPVLREMNGKEITKAMKSAIAKTGRVGEQQIKSGYRKTGIKHPNKSEYGNPIKGIKYVTSKSNLLSITFSVLGDFRLKWFESGTKTRQTKKGYARGKVKATPFFMPAIEAMKDKIAKMYTDSFDWSLNRIINKQRNGK
jgi:hypothetical protein